MDRLSEADLHAIETELGRRIVAEYGLELSGLVLDMMNFATYIDSGNNKAPIARGRHLRARPAVAILAQRVRRAQPWAFRTPWRPRKCGSPGMSVGELSR